MLHTVWLSTVCFWNTVTSLTRSAGFTRCWKNLLRLAQFTLTFRYWCLFRHSFSSLIEMKWIVICAFTYYLLFYLSFVCTDSYVNHVLSFPHRKYNVWASADGVMKSVLNTENSIDFNSSLKHLKALFWEASCNVQWIFFLSENWESVILQL